MITITEHTTQSSRHTTFYLAAGPEDGPLIIFVHGWPELSISWRHQLPVMGGLGFRAVAPDMRGYGRSSFYRKHSDYAQREVVADMLELLDALGRDKAVWVGHDWGSPTVWRLAAHHPDRCIAVANLCVPYYALDRGIDGALAYVDRNVYPQDTFPLRPVGLHALLRGEFRQGDARLRGQSLQHRQGAVPQGQRRRRRKAVPHRLRAARRRLVRRRRGSARRAARRRRGQRGGSQAHTPTR